MVVGTRGGLRRGVSVVGPFENFRVKTSKGRGLILGNDQGKVEVLFLVCFVTL